MKFLIMLFVSLFAIASLADSPGSIGIRRSVGVPQFLDTAVTNVTSSAWVQFVAANGVACSAIQIHNTGTSPIKIGYGGAGVEVDGGEIFPIGVSILVPMIIGKNVRISVRSLGATQSSGVLTMACFQ